MVPALIERLEGNDLDFRLTNEAGQSLKPGVFEEMKAFLLMERGLQANWLLDIPIVPNMPLEGSSCQLALFYAARAVLLGEPVHHGIVFTGAVTPEGGLSKANYFEGKEAAAHDLGLRVVAPAPAPGALPLDSLEQVDSYYPGYLGKHLLDDLRSREQYEQDLYAVNELESLTEVLANPLPGAKPAPAPGLAWSWLAPWLRDTHIAESGQDGGSLEDFIGELCDDFGSADANLSGIVIEGCDRDNPAPKLIQLGAYFAIRRAHPELEVYWETRPAASDSVLIASGSPLPKSPMNNALIVRGALDATEGCEKEVRLTLSNHVSKPPRLIKALERARTALESREDFRPPNMSECLEGFVGRKWLAEKVQVWLKEERHAQKPRVLFLGAKPGWGKTSFIANLVRQERGASAVYYCQDELHDPERFVKALASRLTPYCPEVSEAGDLNEEGRQDRRAYLRDLWIHYIKKPLSHRTSPVVLFLDALDTAVDIADLLKSVESDLPNCLRIVATGRYDAAPTVLGGLAPGFILLPLDGAENLEDLRTYVAERVHELFQDSGALSSTRPLDEGTDRIVKNAAGLFIYAKYAIAGVKNNKWTFENLPKDLTGAYAKWFGSYSKYKENYQPILSLICAARPPFGEELIRAWLDDERLTTKKLRDRVRELLPFLQNKDGNLSFYHSTIKEWLASESNEEYGVDLEEAHKQIIAACQKASDWPELFRKFTKETSHDAGRYDLSAENNPLVAYSLKHLPHHLMQAGISDEAARLLTNFDFQMLRCGLTGEGARISIEDLKKLLANGKQRLDEKTKRDLEIWRSFLQEKMHILRRADDCWPAYKILLQIAVEHANNSPVTTSADDWLQRTHGRPKWPFLRNAQRPPGQSHSFNRGTLHFRVDDAKWLADMSDGVLPLEAESRIATFCNKRFQLFDLESWDEIQVPLAEGHSDFIFGAIELKRRHSFLTWSADGCLCEWDAATGAQKGRPITHNASTERFYSGNGGHVELRDVKGVLELSNGRILSWGADKRILVWDLEDSIEPRGGFTGPEEILGVVELSKQRILSWSERGLYVWDLNHFERIKSHLEVGAYSAIEGALDWTGNIVLWWCQSAHVLWNTMYDGKLANALATVGNLDGSALPWGCHKLFLGGSHRRGALKLKNGNVLIWHKESGPIILDNKELPSVPIKPDHSTGDSLYFKELPSGKIVSWGGLFPKLWDKDGGFLRTLDGHSDEVNGALELPDGRILTWSNDNDLRLHDLDNKESRCLGSHDRSIGGARLMQGERIVSWAWDGKICQWEVPGLADPPVVEKESDPQLARLTDGRWLVGKDDGTIDIRDATSGEMINSFEAHDGAIGGIICTPGEQQILSWGGLDGLIKIWSLPSLSSGNKQQLKHPGPVQGLALLKDRRILSWSSSYKYSHLGPSEVWIWRKDLRGYFTNMRLGTAHIEHVLQLSDGRVFSWVEGARPIVWDLSGENGLTEMSDCYAYSDAAPIEISNGRILSAERCCLYVWHIPTDHRPAKHDHTEGSPHRLRIKGIVRINEDGVLTWSSDGIIAIWGTNPLGIEAQLNSNTCEWTGPDLEAECEDDEERECSETIFDVDSPSNNQIRVWYVNGTVRLWDLPGRRELGSMRLDTLDVLGVPPVQGTLAVVRDWDGAFGGWIYQAPVGHVPFGGDLTGYSVQLIHISPWHSESMVWNDGREFRLLAVPDPTTIVILDASNKLRWIRLS